MRRFLPSLFLLTLAGTTVPAGPSDAPTPADAGAGGPVRVQLRNELDLHDGFRGRIWLRTPDRALLLKARQDAEGAVELQFGLAAPGLLAGPLRQAGLLREMLNPLGFGVGSTVFDERTRFALDGALSFGSRRGLVVSPLGDTLDLFLWGAGSPAGSGLHSGALMRAGLGEARVEALLVGSNPPGRPAGTEWYLPRATHPGGRLLHAGARVRGESSGACLTASGALSSGELVPPGFFLHLDLDLRTDGLGVELCGGVSTEEYVTPEGRPVDNELTAGARLSGGPAAPLQPFQWKLQAWRSIEHPPPAAAAREGPLFREGRLGLAAEACLPLPVHGRLSRAIEAEVERKTGFPATGGCRTETAFDLRFQAESPSTRLRAGFGWHAGWRAGLAWTLDRRAGRWDLEYGWKQLPAGALHHRLQVELKQVLGRGLLFMKAGFVGRLAAEDLQAAIGWETGTADP